MARDGKTDDPRLAAVLTVKNLNRMIGTNIAPWEVDDLPDEWLKVCLAMIVELPQEQRRLRQVAKADAIWRQQFPSMRKGRSH